MIIFLKQKVILAGIICPGKGFCFCSHKNSLYNSTLLYCEFQRQIILHTQKLSSLKKCPNLCLLPPRCFLLWHSIWLLLRVSKIEKGKIYDLPGDYTKAFIFWVLNFKFFSNLFFTDSTHLGPPFGNPEEVAGSSASVSVQEFMAHKKWGCSRNGGNCFNIDPRTDNTTDCPEDAKSYICRPGKLISNTNLNAN
jgi:hypothetical protein